MSLSMRVIGNEVLVESEVVATVKENSTCTLKQYFIESVDNMNEIISENENLNDEIEGLENEIENLKDEING